MSHFHGEDPRGRARSLSPPLVRSPSSRAAGEGWGTSPRGQGGDRSELEVKASATIKAMNLKLHILATMHSVNVIFF